MRLTTLTQTLRSQSLLGPINLLEAILRTMVLDRIQDRQVALKEVYQEVAEGEQIIPPTRRLKPHRVHTAKCNIALKSGYGLSGQVAGRAAGRI